ncbi:SET domain-containing protein 3 [Coniothyrium glycines]
MTDVASVKVHAEPQPTPHALFAGSAPPAYTNGGSPTPLDGPIAEEDSSTIKCICGFSDDDGNTVLCERCDTWQHIVCYYESANHVPDVHECADCSPRTVDARSAADKQRLRRELHSIGERKGRPKTTTKNPKKRTKDPLGPSQPNGWPVPPNNDLLYNPDRKSGSPRDQPPPNKRPKTSHRSSGSMSMLSQVPALAPSSRKRGGSVVINGHSPIKSPTLPDGPLEDYSADFMNLYTQPEPPSVDTNSYTTINVANDIANWLTDPEALAEASGGKRPQDLFSRIEIPIQELESSTAPQITKQVEVDSSKLAHGQHPQWHLITAETPVADGGYIGELKGLVGRKAEYFAEPENRWDLLRHPEPFVFFPPYLPIYIDTRKEGNILRYARRSCAPNMTMKIFIEASNDYHFCFLATREINPGEELTVGWDIDSEVQKQLAKVITNGAKEGFKRIQPWVSCVLANFGGCACDPEQTGNECLLERARRPPPDSAPQKTKVKKVKKSQVSPLSTGRATNSRAGSETLHRDGVDDDDMDARSTSGSHKSSSRDITPATHFSMDGDLKMSEREKRKLQQQERLFEKIDFDEQHKGKKGKRHSAGSTFNTPNIMSSRRLGHPEPSPSARHREHSHGVARKTSGSSTKTIGRTAPKPRPVYKEASTQTDDVVNAQQQNVSRPREMKPPLSFKRKLLQQAQEDKLQRERLRSASVKMEARSPALKDVTSTKPSPLPPSPPLEEPTAMELSTDAVPISRHRELTPAKEPTPPPTADIEMAEAGESSSTKPPEPEVEVPKVEDPKVKEPKVEELPDAPVADARSPSPDTSEPPTQTATLPQPTSPTEPSPKSAVCASKAVDLHVEMPIKFDSANAFGNREATPGSTSAISNENAVSQSSGAFTIVSPFSPAVTNAVKPTPARKKLSLSDYTNRRAKLAQTNSVGSNSTPPLANSQSTSSPTLSTASLPTTNSPPLKAAELPPVAEETKSLEGMAAVTEVIPSTST